MTFYLQTYPYNHTQQRPSRRVLHRWVENGQRSLGVNIREEDEAYILSALVPGLKAEDLNIQILDDVVTIEGEFKFDEQEYLVSELPHGSFQRTLELPNSVDAEKAEARITDGVLTLRLPKVESARPRTIKVNTK